MIKHKIIGDKSYIFKYQLIALVFIFSVILTFFYGSSIALGIENRYVLMSNNSPSSKNVTYQIGFTFSNDQTLGSVVIEACSNSPLIDINCEAPDGFSWIDSFIYSQSGVNGFSISNTTSSNQLVLALDSQEAINQGLNQQFTLNGITNPSNPGSLYFRILTYESIAGSGPITNSGGVATQINDYMAISTEVPPMLYFCIGITISGFDCASTAGSYIDFGELSPSSPSVSSSQFVVGTNADFGYAVNVYGNTMTSGNNVINNLNSPANSIAGQSQFGMNLRYNSSLDFGQELSGSGLAEVAPDYNIPDRFKFNSGDLIAFSNDVSLQNKFTTTYLVNIPSDQKPGVYATSILYTALASF